MFQRHFPKITVRNESVLCLAAEAKGIVRRDVVETVTPGTAMQDRLLAAGRNNFLVSVTASTDSGLRPLKA